MRVILDVSAEARANGIREDVRCDALDIFVTSNYVLKESLLPEPPFAPGQMRKGRTLLEHRHESAEIGIRSGACYQRVQMVRHEAVRDHFETVVVGSAEELSCCVSGIRSVREPSSTFESTSGEEIRVCANVVKSIEAPRSHHWCREKIQERFQILAALKGPPHKCDPACGTCGAGLLGPPSQAAPERAAPQTRQRPMTTVVTAASSGGGARW